MGQHQLSWHSSRLLLLQEATFEFLWGGDGKWVGLKSLYGSDPTTVEGESRFLHFLSEKGFKHHE